MKYYHLVVILFYVVVSQSYLCAQSNNVGIGTLAPHPSALLDVDAINTNKGLLIPRLTSVQRFAISSPANSLLVFDTDSACFFFWNAVTSNWKSLCSLAIGITGATGIAGITGAIGATGSTGYTGATGLDGALNAWSLNGNDSTNTNINFIGTTDSADFIAKTSNIERIRITSEGNIGIGITAPTSKLEVNGAIASGVATYPTFGSAVNYTLDGSNSIIIVTGTGIGATTFTLPLANTCPGRVYYFKNVATTSVVSISTLMGNFIESATITHVIPSNGGIILASDGILNWYIVGKY